MKEASVMARGKGVSPIETKETQPLLKDEIRKTEISNAIHDLGEISGVISRPESVRSLEKFVKATKLLKRELNRLPTYSSFEVIKAYGALEHLEAAAKGYDRLDTTTLGTLNDKSPIGNLCRVMREFAWFAEDGMSAFQQQLKEILGVETGFEKKGNVWVSSKK